MSAPPEWTPVRLKGERWLAVRLSIAPRQLPAFTVTWFDVRAAGPLPAWVLLLGGLGLHVYGEGSEIVVQDRWGSGKHHDDVRLALLVRWVEQDAVRGDSALQREQSLDEGGSAADGALELVRRLTPRKPSSAFVEEVRARLLAGQWELPAGKPLPSYGVSSRGLPPIEAEAERSRERAPAMRPPDADRASTGHWWVVLFLAFASIASAVLLLAYLDLPEFLRTLAFFLLLGGVFASIPTMIRLAEHRADVRRARARQRAAEVSPQQVIETLAQASATVPSGTYRTSPQQHDHTNFLQLHDAVRLEGVTRLASAGDGGKGYETYMAELLLRYRLLTDPPARTEAS